MPDAASGHAEARPASSRQAPREVRRAAAPADPARAHELMPPVGADPPTAQPGWLSHIVRFRRGPAIQTLSRRPLAGLPHEPEARKRRYRRRQGAEPADSPG